MYDPTRMSGESLPLWYNQGASEHTSPSLPTHLVDVAIIGAGMAGLSIAYHLLRAGKSVVVLDKGNIGSGETGRTTAHIANALDDHFFMLERMHGEEGARLAAASHTAAIASIESIANAEDIACAFSRVDGFLFLHAGTDRHELEQELAAAQRAGLEVDLLPHAPVPFLSGPALRFRNQAQFHPMAYLLGLAKAITRMGGKIITGAHVTGVQEDTPLRVQLEGGESLVAGSVVVATNTPIIDRFAMHTKQAPYRSYVIGVPVLKGSIPRALYWDTGDPYHYLRLAGDDDLLLVGGEDHKVGQDSSPEDCWARLEDWTMERFPTAGAVQFRWSGQVQEPADGLAFIGKNPGLNPHVYIVTGDSGNGITHGALAGVLISDLICDRSNPWKDLYDPSRKILGREAAREFVKENVNVALHYGQWLLPGDRALPQIEPGHGAVLRRGMRRVAVYVDDDGQRHECSAKCPHLGCIVAWNRAERSWDCPCHGSRFDPYGHVLTGPAQRDLGRLDQEQPALDPPASAE